MALTRFQTDERLWKRTALALFAVAWLVPIWGFKTGPLFPAILFLWMTLAGFWDPDTPFRVLAVPATAAAVFAAASGVAAVLIGWVVSAVVVIIRTWWRGRGKPPH